MKSTEVPPPPMLLLASLSPRRRELLENAGLQIQVMPSGCGEEPTAGVLPPEQALLTAREKVSAVLRAVGRKQLLPALPRYVLAADTTVWIHADAPMLGKPVDADHAFCTLRSLSGRTHLVSTGYSLHDREGGREIAGRTVTTEVTFRNLQDEEIMAYLSTGEPFDKAGAYGIQGLGSVFVREIRGSYSNVVGLPMCELFEDLLAAGVLRGLPWSDYEGGTP